jgi:hypothetical protein
MHRRPVRTKRKSDKCVARTVDLDSFGELYAGFNEDRAILKRLRGANKIWIEAFKMERRRRPKSLSDDYVASVTMKSLMDIIKPYVASLENDILSGLG